MTADALHHALARGSRLSRADVAGSVLQSVATGLPVGEQTIRYSPSPTLGPSDVEGLLAHDWRARREILQPAGDLTREGFTLRDLPEWVDEAAVMSWVDGDDTNGTPGLLQALRDFWAESEAYGGGVLVAVADDGRPPSEPLDLGALRRVTSWEVLDRFSVWPYRASGLAGPVDYWLINSHNGRIPLDLASHYSVIHPSRTVMHIGAWMPGRWRMQNQGWGLSRLELLRDQRDSLSLGLSHLGRLLSRSSQDVLSVGELAELQEAAGDAVVAAKLAVAAQAMHSLGLFVVDGGIEGNPNGNEPGRVADKFQTFARPLGGASDISTIQHEDWRRGSTMPRVIADGEVAGGINSGEGAGEWRSWASTVAAMQRDLTPWVNWALGLIFASKEGPTGGRVPESWTIEWTPIAEPDHETEAKVTESEARADRAYVDMGALTVEEVRQWRQVDGKRGPIRVESVEIFAEPTPEEIEAERLAQADPGQATEAENVAAQALTGGQITALMELAMAVSAGDMPPEVATWLVELAVPGLGSEGARTAMAIAERFGEGKPKPVPPVMVPGQPPQPPQPPPPDDEEQIEIADGFAQAFGLRRDALGPWAR